LSVPLLKLLEELKGIPYVWKEMKEAEAFQSVKVEEPPFVFRADGVGFGKYFKELGEARDEKVHGALVRAAEELMRTYSCAEAYVSSDEVSVLCGSLPYGGRIEKIVSIFSSLLGSIFSVEVQPLPPGWFDGRVIVGVDWRLYLKWRLKVTLCNYLSLITRLPCSKALERVEEVDPRALGTLLVWEEYLKEGYDPIKGMKVMAKRRRIKVVRGEELLDVLSGALEPLDR